MSNQKNVLILGASGQVGSAIVEEAKVHLNWHILKASHRSIREFVQINYAENTSKEKWTAVLRELDLCAVINCVGIWKGTDSEFELLQYTVPTALMDACEELDIQLIHISALGFIEQNDLPYMHTKVLADKYLQTKKNKVTCVMPSLVYGPNGGSSKFFKAASALPLLIDYGLPANLQPVHEKDVAKAVLGLLEQDSPPRALECAGTHPITSKEYLKELRAGMGFKPAVEIKLPSFMGKAIFSLGQVVGHNFINKQAWRLLNIGTKSNKTYPNATAYTDFTNKKDAQEVLQDQCYYLARFSNAFIWAWTGFATWTLWDPSETLFWLAAMAGPYANTNTLLASCVFDIVMGVLTVIKPSKKLWQFQAGVTIFYSLCLLLFLPWTLAHPFGPLSKNLAVLVGLKVLHSFERDSR